MQDIQTTLPTGFIVQKRYKIEELLGKGGFGAVYLVRDLRMKSNVFALKELLDSTAARHSALTREGKMLQQLDHPSLPRVYYTFRDDTLHRSYILMDYIPGPNLEEVRKGEPDQRLPLKNVLHIMSPIFDAVSYLHALKPPIIHRDIKPANIIVPAEGENTVLVDFGIAKEYDMEGTTTAIRLCSPGYGAPEQYALGTNLKTDIYGLGATIYALLTGVVPTDALIRLTQTETRHNEPLKSVSAYAANVPHYIDAVIQQAMALHSEDRFATVEAFWQALNTPPVISDTPSVVGIALPVTPIPVPPDKDAIKGVIQEDKISHPDEVDTEVPSDKDAIQENKVSDPDEVDTEVPSDKDAMHAGKISHLEAIDTKVPFVPLVPARTIIRKNSAQHRRRLPLLLLLIAALLLLISGAGALLYFSDSASNGNSRSISHAASPVKKATLVATPRPTVTPRPTATPPPTVTPTKTSMVSNPPPTSASYPILQSGYNGNITDKYTSPYTNSTMTLSRITQNGATIAGSFSVGTGLVSSNNFAGTVTADNKIEFTVPGYAGLAPLLFDGQIQSNGSMAGSYCSYRGNNQCDQSLGGWGDWNATPASVGGRS